MSVTVSYDSLLSFLDTQLDPEPTPTTEPTGLCLLAGGIVGRNLEDALGRRGIPTAGLAVSTIEDTATSLLDSHHRRRTDDPEPVEILDQQLCEQLLVDTITSTAESDSLDAVDDLLSGFDWAGRPALRETLWNELDRYFRMTDAGSDHEAAVGVAVDLTDRDPYAGARSQQALTAFDQLHTALQRRTVDLPKTTYLSRSHLVRASRDILAAEWEACYPDVEWVAVDTISVLDDPTLRLFETLATLSDGPDIYLFGTETGAGPRLSGRLEAAGLDPTLEPHEGTDQPYVTPLMNTVEGTPPAELSNVEFIEAPDRRRELDHVAGRIRELIGMAHDADEDGGDSGTACGNIVIAAKDVIPYRSRIADVFTTHSVPTHIEARQPLMQTSGYRYLRAVFELLSAVDSNDPITAQTLVDPVRLGFCPPGTVTDAWPVDGDTVAEIEDRLAEGEHSAEGEYPAERRPFADWCRQIRTEFPPAELPAIHTYIEWIAERADAVPESGETVVELIDDLLTAHIAPLTERGVRRPTGPGIDGTRTALTTKHDSHAVSRLRDHADSVGSYIEQATATDLGDPGWALATTAIKNVCGGGSYWPRNADANAVRIVNAANAHYLTADHVFVIGLAAEEFPADRSPPTVFHEEFYRAVRTAAAEADDSETTGYLHAPTTQSQFEGDVDEYRAAISAAAKGVWLCRQFRDTEGEAVPWSGFVDAYTSQNADDIHRIGMDEWLPAVEGSTDQTAIQTATPRDRLRLLAATFPEGIESTVATGRSAASLTDRDSIVDLLSRADGEAYSQEIEPRRKRYRGEDLQAITVDPERPLGRGDTAGSGGSLAELSGPPIRVHELDLYATCPLKFYFYQYLDGGGQRRDEVSTTGADPLPPILRERYPDRGFSEGVRQLLTSTDRLGDRQAAFSRYDSLGAFRDQLADWIEHDPLLDPGLMQPMLGEYRTVQQELDAGIDREWRWEPASTVRIDGHAVRLPGHRVDYIPQYEFSVPVWYTTGSVAEHVVRQSLTPTSTGVRDHRLLLGAEAVDSFGGTLVCDPTSAAASARQGFFVDDLNPIPDRIPQESNLTRTGRADWRDISSQWLEATASCLDSMTTVDEPITYRVPESFVESGGCAGCGYRGLCQVPASRQRGGQ